MSKGFHRFLQREKVTGAWKAQITLSVTLAFTLASEQMPRQEEVAHDRMGKMAAEWHRVGLERPHFSPLARGEKTAGSLQPTRSPRSVSRGEGELGCCWPSREVTSFSRSTAASPGKSATNAESCSVRFVSRGTANRKCTALANVGVMLIELRSSGQDGRANTKPTAIVEPQRRDSSRSIGRILTWKKLSVFNQKQRTCRRKNCLSRTWVQLDLENPSVRAGERKWRPRQNSRCTLFRQRVLFRRRQSSHRAMEARWQGSVTRRACIPGR